MDTLHQETVYGAIADAGEEFGLRRLGISNYCRNHTQGGYPNQWIHYWYPWLTSGEELRRYTTECPYINPMNKSYAFFGSASDNPENAFVTPFDVGWDSRINYDHEFIGKEALLELKKNPPRKAVTRE